MALVFKAADLGLIRTVTEELKDRRNARIDVRIAGLKVDGVDLAMVGDAVRDGTIRVATGALGTRSEYETSCNEIRLSNSQTGNARGAQIIHEAVHASFDLREVTTREIDEEIVCYLAVAAFLRIRFEPSLPYNRRLADMVLGKQFAALSRELPALRGDVGAMLEDDGTRMYDARNRPKNYDGILGVGPSCPVR